MHVSYGSVNGRGKVQNQGSGDWRVTKGDAGHYTIEVDLNGHDGGAPVVTATGSVTGGGQASDNVFSVAVTSQSSFVVGSRDVAGWRENEFQDAAFSFVAIWP